MELLAPLAVNWVTPESAPKMVVAAAPAEIVSFGAAKTAVDVVVVMALPPAVVSATTLAPDTVMAELVELTTNGPEVVATPLPLKTV
jgi:hypothetical protein